jgi:putative ABC transport system substrate-binding protein
MKRRTVLATLAPALAGWRPLVAVAQPVQSYFVAVLGNEESHYWNGLRDGLRDLGYVAGRNLRYEGRWSQAVTERFPALAAELVALRPDVMVVSGSQAARAAQAATQTIPIVMALSSRPERLGLVQSLARPGGNITGLSTYAPQLAAKKLELLLEIVPHARRIAILWTQSHPAEDYHLRDLEAAAAVARVDIVPIDLPSPEALDATLTTVAAARAHALMVIGNPATFRRAEEIAAFALAQRLPTMFEEQRFVELGGLLSYGVNFTAQFRRAADYVDRILKGAKPADLPVEQPTSFELAVNRTTARQLGLTIPSALLLRADVVRG